MFDDFLKEISTHDNHIPPLQNAINFINLAMALISEDYEKVRKFYEKTKPAWSGDVVAQGNNMFEDVIRTFTTLLDMHTDLKELFNPAFLHMSLSYRLRTVSIENVIKGMNFKQVETAKFEEISFAQDLKMLLMQVDPATKRHLRQFFPS